MKLSKIKINVKDDNGDTPFLFAIKMKDIKMVIYLIHQEKIDVNVQDKNGKTALHLILEIDDKFLQKQMLKIVSMNSNLNFDIPDKEGRKPFDGREELKSMFDLIRNKYRKQTPQSKTYF